MASSPCDIALKAALGGKLRLLKRMAKKVDLRRAKDDKGQTALHFAAAKGCLDSCKFLVEETGLDVDSATKTGVTPMFYAAFGGNVEVMRYLLDGSADPSMADDRGSVSLHNAAEEGGTRISSLFFSKGVHVDAMDHRGTPLHLAVAKDHVEVVKVLLEHGADPNRVANHVFSPLMMAVCGKALKCMKLLIEAGADVNVHGYSGPTPLTEAVDDGLMDFVMILLEAGADANIPNQHGAVPIELAAARGQRELVEMLFPKTKPIPSQPVWSINGIMNTARSPHIKHQDASSVEQRIADLKSCGKEAFGKEDYITAMYFYGLVMDIDPLDATMFANRSLCWLWMREGDRALEDARQCVMMRPRWSKAWYREGKALSFMKDYKGAANAFLKAQELDPKSDEITKALREAVDAMEELRV
ncbi:putative ankyrin repeat protein RF_0381 [Triticum urartu]|uniref:putative ankyrin repeat protein RF_0381 n=1 Tax=Triticum urartu TaxID=4572 RepID=UPI002043C39C|nr:putative ankyrin repeat protein RF_0381 [Triticum urartu]